LLYKYQQTRILNIQTVYNFLVIEQVQLYTHYSFYPICSTYAAIISNCHCYMQTTHNKFMVLLDLEFLDFVDPHQQYTTKVNDQ